MSRQVPEAGELLAGLASGREDRVRHVERIPARAADHVDLPDWVAPPLRAALAGAGIDRLWSHQARAAQAARDGRHVVLATGTASGKSLGYLLPSLTAVLEGRAAANGRGATALYLSPTKALAADQLARIQSWAVPGVRAATYDGDTPTDERRWIRDHADVILTNPDLVHHSLLPGHEHWAHVLRRLRYVVIDECHVYRGVFGSHVALLLRRLRRVARRYGADPIFVLASATVGDPGGLASRLVGDDVLAVTEDGSPRGAMTFALWQPPEDDEGARRSPTTEAADLMAHLVGRDVQTLAFARSRAGVEALASAASRQVSITDEGRIAAYRGGYLPEERRVIERRLRERDLLGLAATNALELGIDIAGLDAVLMVGWPGRLASVWQQAGRAGRDGQDALAVLVAADDPLDTWVVEHPEAIFDAPVETSVLDPGNVHVLVPHVACAAAELPVTRDDEQWFGPGLEGVLEVLVARGLLRKRPGGWFWTRPDRPGEHVSLRGIGEVVSIVEGRSGRVIGTVDESSAHSQVHTGAVHVHQGRPYVVTELDLEQATATVVPGDPGWSTHAQSVSSFDIVAEESGVDHGPVRVSFGRVDVRHQVTGFLRRLPGGEVIGQHPLDLPERTLSTRAVWWTMTPEALAAAGVAEVDVPGAAHAAEHAAIGMLPLLATCDRWDIGGVSTDLHPDTGLPTIMVYDGQPGGAGFAARAHEQIGAWLAMTRETIARCGCAGRGCPACVVSPKCGNGNEPLDARGAVALLDLLLTSLGHKVENRQSSRSR
ncbi:DEAD/DEAH box helicase [Janibacter sp. CX7]|uniref:DEAD/DEAH box helicase n=1 Tax=Janibacter sp. CX7 TaxID=2963431 RepID=UPI0020CD6373|nr:DEAD/DEAH box helicase [Janibacter sp. CX7]UTT65623.1 DEAD/DEAH box helicase [Janibacter sp. CX7]